MIDRFVRFGACAVLALACTVPADAMCRPLVRPTEQVLVSGDQRVFVFHRNGVQHLILENVYKGRARDFGLLLPLPAPPEVKKVDRQCFRALWSLSATWRNRGTGPTGPGLASTKTRADGVQVIARQVAGIFEAVTLKATSTDDFVRWLDRHGYAHPTDAEPVFEHYVKKRWYFVAIRITPGKAGAAFDGALPPMGFRFKSKQMVLPTRMASMNPRGMNFDLYLLGDAPVTLPDFPTNLRRVRRKVGMAALRRVKGLRAELDQDVFLDAKLPKFGLEHARRLARQDPDAYGRQLERRYRGLWLTRYRGFFPRSLMQKGDLRIEPEREWQRSHLAPHITQLTAAQPHVRDAARRALVDGGPAAVPALLSALEHSDFRVRRAIAEILGTIEAQSAVAPLITRLLKEDDDFVKSAIGRTLRSLTGQDIPTIMPERWAAWWMSSRKRR